MTALSDANIRVLKAALHKAILRVHMLDEHFYSFRDCTEPECVEARRLL